MVGYLDDYLPYCGTDKGGNATGLVSDIMPDLFKALPGECEIEIVYQSFSDQQEMLDCLKSGEIDLAMPVSDGSIICGNTGIPSPIIQMHSWLCVIPLRIA